MAAAKTFFPMGDTPAPDKYFEQVELKSFLKRGAGWWSRAGLGQKLSEAGQGSVSHGGGNIGRQDSFVVAKREREQPWAELQKDKFSTSTKSEYLIRLFATSYCDSFWRGD